MHLVESISYDLNVQFIQVSLRDTTLEIGSYEGERYRERGGGRGRERESERERI